MFRIIDSNVFGVNITLVRIVVEFHDFCIGLLELVVNK